MKTTTAKAAAAKISPQLAKAALSVAPKATPAAWYASPRSLAEAKPLTTPEPGSSAWLADQRNARRDRAAAELGVSAQDLSPWV